VHEMPTHPVRDGIGQQAQLRGGAAGKVHIHALRDIAAGEGLSYCFGIVLDEPYTPALRVLWACRCGSSACTETLLQPKAEANPAPAKKKGAVKRKKAAAK